MPHPARTSARLAALGAAAFLSLTACSSGTAGTEVTTSAASETASASATESAEARTLSAGTCLKAEPGVRDVKAMEVVDCGQEHTAEYLWAVPAAEAGSASGSASASAPAADTEQTCRTVGASYGQDLGAVLTATELRDSADQSQHCIAYSLTDPWKGQAVDPEITLEKAQAQAAS